MNNQLPTGVLLLDKPIGPTSHDLVAQVRQLLLSKKIKVGHAGTLDPFATGLLVIGIGSATRLLEYTKAWSKEYEAEITLGATSTTDDTTGTLAMHDLQSTKPPHKEKVQRTVQEFVGEIDQVPPGYAAIKVNGKKLYEYARAGEVVEIKPRRISIHTIEVLTYTYPTLRIRVSCGSGTYIRALARDIGAKLAVGGYCSELRRTKHGDFKVDNAIRLPDLHETDLVTRTLPATTLITHLPKVTLTETQVAAFHQGQHIALTTPLPPQTPIAVFTETGHLIGTAIYNEDTKTLQPEKVLH